MGTTGGPDGALTGVFTEKAYHDAILLVNDTVGYLETRGIVDRESLDALGRTAFAAESMRLTTRLMQVVSWFMVQRAVMNGELSKAEANEPERRLSAIDICLDDGMKGSETLPQEMQALLSRSRSLFEQVWHVEEMLLRAPGEGESPVHNLLNRLDH